LTNIASFDDHRLIGGAKALCKYRALLAMNSQFPKEKDGGCASIFIASNAACAQSGECKNL